MAKPEDHKKYLETHVNNVAKAIKILKDAATESQGVMTKTNAKKIGDYLKILVENLGIELNRLAETNVPLPGEFSLDADIPEPPKPSIPQKPIYRGPQPDGRPVGQKPGAVKADPDDISFIDDKES